MRRPSTVLCITKIINSASFCTINKVTLYYRAPKSGPSFSSLNSSLSLLFCGFSTNYNDI